jgi:hypothetical protein
MYVLHHFHDLRRAVLATLAAAGLAIVFALAIAGGLNDLSGSTPPASAPSSHAVAASAINPVTSNPFTHSPFASPFTAQVRLPWAVAPVRVPWASAAR